MTTPVLNRNIGLFYFPPLIIVRKSVRKILINTIVLMKKNMTSVLCFFYQLCFSNRDVKSW